MAAIAYEKYSKSLVESFRKSITPEKDFVDKHKGIFNSEVHASFQLIYHRLMSIGTGVLKSIEDLTTNKFAIDPNKPADIKGTVSVLTAIQNDINKYLNAIIGYNQTFPQKFSRVLPTVDKTSSDIKESKLRRYQSSPTIGTLSASKTPTQTGTDQAPTRSSAIAITSEGKPLGQTGFAVLNGTLNRILTQLKSSQSDNAELMSDQLNETKYQSGLKRAVPIEKGSPAKDRAEKSDSDKKGFGSLIGSLLKPLLDITAPIGKLIPGMLRMLGMNKVAGLMGRIPGLGLLTTATASIIAIDYLNKNPEAIGKIVDTIGDVTKFAVTTLGKLVGDQLPTTAMTIGKLVVSTVGSVYHGFVESIKDSIAEGNWKTAAAEIALFGGVVWMAVKKLRMLASKFEKMIPSSSGGGVDMDDDYIDDSGSPTADRKNRRNGKSKAKRVKRPGGSRVKGFARGAKGLGKSLLKGAGVGMVTSMIADVGFGLVEDSMGIDEENRYKQTGAKAAMVGVSNVASDAMTGAAIGSMIPVVGTAMGALIGAGVGLTRTWYAMDQANGKSKEAIEADTAARLKNAGMSEKEAEARAKVLAELIDSETMFATGAKETEKLVNEFRVAMEGLDKTKNGKNATPEAIAIAERKAVDAARKLQYDNRDVFNSDDLYTGTGMNKTKMTGLLNDAKTNAKMIAEIQLKALHNAQETVNPMSSTAFDDALKKVNMTRAEYQKYSSDVRGYARGGDVADGLHMTGENGLEMYYKKGSQTKVFNKADSNLKTAMADEFADIGKNQAVSITKKIVESTSDAMSNIGSIMENTVNSLLAQMSELKPSKSETSAINNTSQQSVVNNYNNTNSVSSGSIESYARIQKFVPRFA